MIKKIYILVILTLSALVSNAQQSYTQTAYKYFEQNDYVKAALYSDSAVLNDKENSSAFTWHVRGYVYKEYYKNIDKLNSRSEARVKAIEAFKKSIELDSENQFKENNLKNIEYLAIAYYNDAVKTLNIETYQTSEEFYYEYKKLMIENNIKTDFNKSDAEYYNAMATVMIKAYNKLDNEADKYFDKAIEYYKKVLTIDEENCFALYQIGILYYNRGVDIILSLEDTADLEKVIEAQEKLAQYMSLSEPYLKKAWEIFKSGKECKNVSEIIEGLKGINYQRQNTEEMQYWEKIQKQYKE
jgi:tetratricopeptide (TPR) repeat protein